MVLRLGAWRIAIAAMVGFTGCVWMEEAPTGGRLKPSEYEPRLLEAYYGYAGLAEQFSTPSTREISAFLGTGKFRIAVVMRDPGPGSPSWPYVLHPGQPDSAPRIAGYSLGGTYRYSDVPLQFEACLLSPDGNALVFSHAPALPGYWQPFTQWMQTLSGRDWLVPLSSRANRSLGMLGQGPFWHMEDGRQFIVFSGLGSVDGQGGSTVQEARRVERLTDSSVSPVEPYRLHGSIVTESLSGISRGNEWVLVRKHGGEFMLPSERLQDKAFLENPDSLRSSTVGRGAGLNPFDPSRTSHTDYFATLPFSILSGKDSTRDADLSPKALDGKPGNHPDHSGSIWICDRDRNIILSQRLPEGNGAPAAWIHWTNHPNFVVAGQGGRVYLVKLAEDAEALQGNAETSTLQAAGVFRLFTDRQDGQRILDASVWMGGDS